MNTLRTFQQSNDPFTLASLPSDIIRNIIRLDEESLDELRLIGRSWNAQVLELYLTDSLSVVSFHYNQQYPSHVYMYAQMPARNKGRIDLNQWLTISLWSDEVFEVESELFYLGVPRVVYSKMILLSSWIQWIIIVCGFLIFGIRFGLVVIPKIVHYLYKRSAINNTVDGFVNRFKRFFSLFSSIDTLQLTNFISDNVFNNVLKTIENKRIGRLEMQVDKWDRTLQNRIVRLHRRNSISHVMLTTHISECTSFKEFVHELCDLGITMEIYNVDKVRQQQTFLLEHASFWENAAEYLRTKEIIVSMTKEIGYHSNHVLEIKCKKMDK